MKIISDNIDFIQEYFPNNSDWVIRTESEIKYIPLQRFISGDIFEAECKNDFWKLLIAVKESSESQYDQLIKAAQDNEAMPDKLLLIADTGKKFHGLRNRQWVADSGNIHLSIFLSPQRAIKNFGAAVMALPSVSIIEALASLPIGKHKPQIKWVNDIFIGNKKLAGILAHTQQQGAKLSNIIYGIGLNVKKTPAVEPTLSVPGTTSLWEIAENIESISLSNVFEKLNNNLQKNIELLYENNLTEIIEKYREYSMIINRNVRVYDHTNPDEPEICSGIVERIGDHLELYFKGIDKPVTKGRLMLL